MHYFSVSLVKHSSTYASLEETDLLVLHPQHILQALHLAAKLRLHLGQLLPQPSHLFLLLQTSICVICMRVLEERHEP